MKKRRNIFLESASGFGFQAVEEREREKNEHFIGYYRTLSLRKHTNLHIVIDSLETIQNGNKYRWRIRRWKSPKLFWKSKHFWERNSNTDALYLIFLALFVVIFFAEHTLDCIFLSSPRLHVGQRDCFSSVSAFLCASNICFDFFCEDCWFRL